MAAVVLWLFANAGLYLFLKPIYLDPDGIGYFSYLPAIFGRHTLSFLETYQAYRIDLPIARTSTGWVVNIWAFGSSFLWLPFYQVARWSMTLHGSPSAAPGGSFYLGVVNAADMLLSAAISILLYRVLPSTLHRRTRLGIVLAAFFGTPLFYYGFLTGAMSHAPSAFATGLFIWYWWSTIDEPALTRWALLGLLAGVATMVRTQEAIILLAPGVEWLRRKNRPAGGALVLGYLTGMAPQLLLWHFLFGSVLHSPEAFNLSATQFHPLRCLFSPFHGLLPWTPLYALAFVGLAAAGRRGTWKAWPLLAIAGLQLLLYSFSATSWFDFSFGLRQMTGTFFIVGIGLGFLHEEMPGHGRVMVCGMALCSFWTLFLALAAYVHTIHLGSALSSQELLTSFREIPRFVSQIGKQFSGIGHPPISAWILMLFFEVAVSAWIYGLLQWPVRTLCLTLLPGLLYATGEIARASRGPQPDWTVVEHLNETELGNFFQAQSLVNEALAYRHHGDLSRARAVLDQALRIVPRVSQTRRLQAELGQVYELLSTAETHAN